MTDDLILKFKEYAVKNNYGFRFSWLGQHICQEPEDIVAFQRVVWETNPDLIIETGIADGGSLVLSASMLDLLNAKDPKPREVVGIDRYMSIKTRFTLKTHPLAGYIHTIVGDSVSKDVVDSVGEYALNHKRIMVCLDSDHSHKHVLAELEAYSPFVTKNNYCVVFDTCVEDLPKELFVGATCCKGNSPRTAVNEFLKTHPEFEVDTKLENELVLTCAKGGWLKRTRS